MVSSISSTNMIDVASKAQMQKNDVAKLVKYVNNEALTQAPDTFSSNLKSSTGSAAVFEGIPLLNFLRRNKKLGGVATEAMQTLDGKNLEAFQKLFKKGEGKLTEKLANFIHTANESKRAFVGVKDATKVHAKAAKAAEKAAKKGTEKAVKKATVAAEKAAATKITAEAVKTTSKFGKIGKFMKSSGAGIMLAFSGISEFLSEVVPTFKELGFKKGMKQLGKSAVKVVGDTVGFIGGEYLGTALGAAAGSALAGTRIGATIGSVFPGFGTAIGAVVGCACGMLGSFVMGKITKGITGKSEREKAAEQNEQNQVNKLANDALSLEQLKAEAIAKIKEEAEMNNGEMTGDALLAFQALQNLDNTNPFVV